MRSGTYNGASRLHSIYCSSPQDIRWRLPTLYWLARLTAASERSTHVLVELGTREGDSTRALLAAVHDMDNGTILYSYDVCDVQNTVVARTHSLGWSFGDVPWVFQQKDSTQAGKDWKGGPVDMVFIDTDHTYPTTQNEIATWNQHVRVGGCMSFHDYWLHEAGRDQWEGRGVKMAVDEFWGRNRESWALEAHDSVDGDTGWAILWRNK